MSDNDPSYTAVPPAGEAPPSKKVDESGNNLWVRLLYMILFGIVAYVVLQFYLCLALLQFVVFIVVGKPNDELRKFMRRMLHYFGSVMSFLAFMTDMRPFPFSPLPHIAGDDVI